jgi:hypothetical protein
MPAHRQNISADGIALRKVVIATGATEVSVGTSPSVTSGSGVPTAAENNGAIYLRTDGTDGDDSLYMRIAGAWVALQGETA